MGGGPPSRRLPGARGLPPSVPLPVAAAWPDSAAGRLTGAPASIPNAAWPGRKVRRRGRCESTGSRTGFSHCTPRRHIGVDETRDWFRLPAGGDHPDRQAPKALVCVGTLPGILSAGWSLGALPGLAGPRPFPLATVVNVGRRQRRASADVSSAHVSHVGFVLIENPACRVGFGGPFHEMWTCANRKITRSPHLSTVEGYGSVPTSSYTHGSPTLDGANSTPAPDVANHPASIRFDASGLGSRYTADSHRWR